MSDKYTYKSVLPSAQDTSPFDTGYLDDVDGKTALQDPRVLNDLRNYYYELGHDTTSMSDEDLVDEFYSDKTWGLLNTVSAGKRAYETMNASPEQQERMRRLDGLYEKLPNFWQEGGRGVGSALADGTLAVIADPINLIPGGKALQAGAMAAKAGGKSVGLGRAAWEGAKTGAKYEAGIGAGQEVLMGTADQTRDINLGYRDEYSQLGLLGDAAIGGAVGGAVGLGIGAGAGALGRRTGLQQRMGARYLGKTQEEIAEMTFREAEEMKKKAGFDPATGKFAGEKGSERTPEDVEEVAPSPEENLSPEELKLIENESTLDAEIRALEADETRARNDGLDDADILDMQDRITKLNEIKNFGRRLAKEKEEIDELISNVGPDNAEAIKRRDDYTKAASDYRYAVANIGDPVKFKEAVGRILDGLKRPEADTEAPVAPTTPTGGGTPPVGAAAVTEPPVTTEAPTIETPAGASEAPVVPTDAAPTPEVQTEVTIPYRNDRQKTQITKILSDNGMSEADLDVILRDPDNSVIVDSKNGQLTQKNITQLKEHIATKSADSNAPQIDNKPPAPIGIKPELRGLAIANGVNPSSIQPSKRAKNVSKAQVNKAIEAQGEPDPYATKANEELNEILDMIGDIEADPADIHRLIRTVAQGQGFKTDADDLIGLFEHANLNAQRESSVAKALTKTEIKKIKILARQMKTRAGFEQTSMDTLEVMARQEILAQRLQDKVPVRGTGEAIDDAKKFTTAGRASTGKIQGFLKKGTRISKGSDYTLTDGNRINRSAFGFEAALIKARSGKGSDIVEYITMGPEKILTRNGYIDVPKGTTAFADGISGKPFDSQDFAIEYRDGGKPRRAKNVSETPQPEVPDEAADTNAINIAELLEKFGDDPETLVRVLKSKNSQANAPAVPEKMMAPITKGDKYLVIRSKDDPSIVRMIGKSQVAKGQDMSAIVGKNSDPDAWEVRYAPADRYTQSKVQLQKLFEELPPEEDLGMRRGTRLEVGFQTGRGDPIPFEDAGDVVIPKDKISDERLVAGFTQLRRKIPSRLTVADVYMAARSMDMNSRWYLKEDGNASHLIALEGMYSYLDEVAPQGLIRSENTRAQSVEQVTDVFSKYSKEEIENAADFIARLGGDQSIGPRIKKGYGNHQATSGDAATQDITLDGSTGIIADRTSTLYHEVAHWAYEHILTPADKIEFWRSMRKYYDANGNLDKEAIKGRLGVYGRGQNRKGEGIDQMPEFEADGTIVTHNSMDSPQELFANQFQVWAIRQNNMGDGNFWRKITNYVQAVIQRYAKDVAIDPDLEPLFSKILPDAERVKVKLGDGVEPKSRRGPHIVKHYDRLRYVRKDLEDAIARDSASGIVNYTRELVGYMLSAAPRYSKGKRAELAKKKLKASTTFSPFNGIKEKIHNRIDELSEILTIPQSKLDDFGDADMASSYFDDGLSEGLDEQAVADKIIEIYSTGGLGDDVIPLSKTIDEMFEALEYSYQIDEGGSVPGKKPNVGAQNTRRPKRSSAVKKGKAKKAREEKAIDGDAAKVAKTSPNKRPRLDRDANNGLDPEGIGSIKDMKLSDLRKLYVRHRGTEQGDQIAVELLRKEKAKPLPASVKPVPKAIGQMGKFELEDGYLDALDNGDSEAITHFLSEINRRAINKGKKKGDPSKLQVRYISKSKIIEQEIADSVGAQSSDGIPPSARASVRDLLSFITHRDPEVQYTSRTMTYRMLNLLNKTTKDSLGETNILSAADLARVANVQPSEVGSSVFVDVRGPEFKSFRSDIRRMSIGLTKGKSSPFDLIHEIGHMVVRSGVLEKNERDAIVEAYTRANNKTKDRIEKLYSAKYADRTDEASVDLLAQEWFSESLAEYMAERVAKGDILKASVTGDVTSLRMMNTFERTLDKMLEYVAYMVNGLIGRNDIKQQFRRLVLFGDMFDKPSKNPLGDVVRSGPAIHPDFAADAVSDYIMSSPRAKRDKILAFAEDGLSVDGNTGDLIPFYHGTPNGYAFNRADNPNVVLRPSARGFYGPATYLTDNPGAASQTYAKKPTPQSMRSQVMDLDISDEAKEELIYDVQDLHDIRKQISEGRRKYYMAQVTQDLDEVTNIKDDLDELVSIEQSLQDNLSNQGVKTDPLVVPVFVRVRNPINFRHNAQYDSVNDPALRSIIDYFNMTDTLEPNALRALASKFEQGPINGRETYLSLQRMLQDSGRGKLAAQAELNEALDDLGYDGMLTTHYNTLDSNGASERMLNGETYEGEQIPHMGVLVFDTQNVKHVDANEFDSTDPRLYHRLEDSAMPSGTLGAVVRSIADGQIDSMADLNYGAVGEMLEGAQVEHSLSSAVMSMGRRRPATDAEVKALRKHAPLGWFSETSKRLKDMGAHWYGDWFKGHFPDVHQTFAKKYFPLHDAMKALPDATGWVGTWVQRGPEALIRSVTGSSPKQPKSYGRIVSALRRGEGSRQYGQLTTAEKRVYTKIRSSLDAEWSELAAEGIMIGRRAHYLPQVWNREAINANRDEFLNAMANFYIREGDRNGIPARSKEEASKFADQMYYKLAADDADGVFIPEAGGSRNATSDHIDFTRMLDLENDPTSLNELEKFLEGDLQNLLVKYFEGTSRRIIQTQKFGNNFHGFHDYVKVATHGARGIADLLSTNKVFRKDYDTLNTDGFVESVELVDTVAMPFSGARDNSAREFADNLINVYLNSGEAAARQLLKDIQPTGAGGKVPLAYQRRSDAIIAGLSDYKGKEVEWDQSQYYMMQNSVNLALKKPMNGVGGKRANEITKAIKGFNSVTLLGWTTLTSLGDPALTLIRSGSFQDWYKGMKTAATDPDYRKMIHDVGVAIENIVHERQIYMYGASNSKLTNAFFNTTMLTPWTDMNRQAAGAVGYESFKTMQRKANNFYKKGVPIAEQSRDYKKAHRYLTSYGLNDFLPEGSRHKERLSNMKLLSDDDAVRRAVIQFADQSIFQPNPNDIPMWAQTPIASMVFQLKSFPLMMTRLGKYTLDEMFGDFETGKLTANPARMNRNAWPLLYMAAAGPAFGGLALSAKDFSQARGGDTGEEVDLRNRNLLKTMGYNEKIHGNENDFAGWYVEGMMQMGGLGLFGDVLHSVATQSDNGAYGEQRITSALLGPSLGLLTGGVRAFAGAKDAALGTTDSNAKERQAAREVLGRVPVFGGIRKFKEAAVDYVAGESSKDKKEWWE